MRYQPVTTCIECGQRPPMTKKRLCKECWMPKNRDYVRKSKAKKRLREKGLKQIKPVEPIISLPEIELPSPERLRGYLNYVYPKNYAGIRNL